MPCRHHSPSRRAPSVAVDNATLSFTTVTVVVTPPSLAPSDGWAAYQLELCPTLPAGACVTSNCSSPPQASPTTSPCQLVGLVPGTQYAVAATALSGSIASLASSSATFFTPIE